MDISTISANFDEARQSQLPFVELLINLGYTYLPTDRVLAERRNDLSKFILKDITFAKLKEINSYEHKGQTYQFADKDIWDAIEELENIPLEGLIDTSKSVFHLIMPTTGGKAIKVFHGGKAESKNFRFIDFANPENNAFHVAVEFEASGKGNIRPDIVVFVNGIPFAIIENKKSSIEIEEALSQQNRNQRTEYCPKLFVYPQLLVGTNGKEFRYGTAGTPNKFYAQWKEKGVPEAEQDSRARLLISKAIDEEIYIQLCADLNGPTVGHHQILDRIPTEQDRSVIALFEHGRLLDLSKNAVLYDAGIKKISRYQQYFAIRKMFDRIAEDDAGSDGKKRRGGLVWHTQGSGKSLTMVMFVRALIEHPHIKNPRIILVTDRRDLDKQIGDTFRNCGLKKGVVRATSGEHLLELIKEKKLDVITTLVHKFESSSKKKAGFVDESKDIFVLIDEAHRTQGGMASLEMNLIIPNACYIGFTGTPLMKKEKSSYEKFGGYIDKYTIDDALADRIILPLIYEGRYVELTQNTEQIDRHVGRLTEGLSDDQKRDLQKYVEKKVIKDNPNRIKEIAHDVEEHFMEWLQGTELKAQLVAPSKYSAVLFQQYFESRRKIRTAIVISDESGMVDEEDTHKKEVIDYLEKISEKYQSLKSYEDDVVESFKHNDDGIEILIVVDKLLTGFDAPRNTVLYLAKELKDHNLLQAIARVNRLFDTNAYPKTAGFIIDYSENAQNIDQAMKLFGNFDEEDVKGTLIDVKDKIHELEQRYDTVHEFFKDIGKTKDDEAYFARLAEEPDRRMFYEALNGFTRSFYECLMLKDFSSEFKHVHVYKKELKKLIELRKSASLRYADQLDLSEYKNKLVRILDQYVDAQGVELLTQQIEITDTANFAKAIEELGSDKSKAEAIAAQTDRTITEKMDTDPELYKRFSDKVKKLLEEMRAGRLADIEALGQMKLIRDEVIQKKDDELPSDIIDVNGAPVFYRNLKSHLQSYGLDDEQYVEIVLGLLSILRGETIVDWHRNAEVKRIIKNKLDDYLYDQVKSELGIPLSGEDMKALVDTCVQLAEHNLEIFSV
ncbi:MAG: HsdR family type I site-specific deoxyribonuclease [Patescibacteria group bacterium]|jgi:type I restriction enzyme R subunit